MLFSCLWQPYSALMTMLKASVLLRKCIMSFINKISNQFMKVVHPALINHKHNTCGFQSESLNLQLLPSSF